MLFQKIGAGGQGPGWLYRTRYFAIYKNYSFNEMRPLLMGSTVGWARVILAFSVRAWFLIVFKKWCTFCIIAVEYNVKNSSLTLKRNPLYYQFICIIARLTSGGGVGCQNWIELLLHIHVTDRVWSMGTTRSGCYMKCIDFSFLFLLIFLQTESTVQAEISYKELET